MSKPTSLSGEQWKDVESNNKYMISDHGRVWSKNSEIFLSPIPVKKGYLMVSLYRQHGKRVFQRFQLHRLVALHFIPNPRNLPEVNHEDFDVKNNHYKNLSWCTRLENIRHACLHKRRPPRLKLSEEHKRNIGKATGSPVEATNVLTGEIRNYASIRQCARAIGLHERYVGLSIREKFKVSNDTYIIKKVGK